MGNLIVNLHPWSGVKDGDVQPRRMLAVHDRAVGRMMAIADRLGITYSARRAMALMDFDGRYHGDLAAGMHAVRDGMKHDGRGNND